MRILTFQAKKFRFKAFSQTLSDAPPPPEETTVKECIVAFMHVEASDQGEEEKKRCFRKTLKHLKWLANKREFENIVLHSFTHLGGDNADADFANQFINELSARLSNTGYKTWTTPFGYFSEWDIDVYGESLAKVFKAF